MISIIVAMSENGVIGRGGELPWHLPDDLKRFKALTMGHPIIMGRKTFESIGRPLPGRTNIVITRNGHFKAPGAEVVHRFTDAVDRASHAPGGDETFIIGGSAVFREALPLADRLFLTLVQAAVEGDVFFPDLDLADWRLVSEEQGPQDERHRLPTVYRVYDRIRR